MYGRDGYAPRHCEHLCGLYYNLQHFRSLQKSYLPQIQTKVHASILAATSRTNLQQTFLNPSATRGIREVRYAFPLYDGVSVVGFSCHVGNRLIIGEVKEKEKANKVYEKAMERGETAGLLEQLPEASDVFTTTIGNIPPGAKVTVDITYLGELKHDMEVDGIRFTIPTSICPRYGNVSSCHSASVQELNGTISITVDVEVAEESFIQRLQSPSHPISMSMGTTSVDPDTVPSMSKASATLTLGVAHLDTDFVLQVIEKDTGIPKAILETHPTIPNQRALMATLIPKFTLPPEKPEIVFVCDRSGSMAGGSMSLAKEALQVFLKSLPVGVKFNICSFGNRHSFLFPKSATYNQDSLAHATRHAEGLSANYGGTEMLKPLRATVQNRYKDMPLEIILLTDGEIWNQQDVFDYLNSQIQDNRAPIRVFTLSIGSGVSHSLVEGIAKAGNGFSQSVQEGEKMNSKVVRMLKGALSPHIDDYTMEVKYSATSEDDLEIVEKVADSLQVVLNLNTFDPNTSTISKKPISLFDTTSNPNTPPTTEEDRYSHVPSIPIPKVIQAPQSIPSLFAFSRTTIYLLLGPSAPRAPPTSVTLHGTSSHGPLELEVPVQILERPGTMVHQLAAKKAVSELEQGRGWLACAREASGVSNAQGELLKTHFEGRFSDMVEREAVRLGVTFQVGGKWCSFVATESTTPRSDGGSDEAMDEDWEYLEDEKAVGLKVGARREMESGRESRIFGSSAPHTSHGGGARGGMQITGGRGGSVGKLRTLPTATTSQQRFGGQGSISPQLQPRGLQNLLHKKRRSSPAMILGLIPFGGAPLSQPASASLFGAASTSSSEPAFSAAPASKPSTGGLFGSPSASNGTPGGLFGSCSITPSIPSFGCGFSLSTTTSASSNANTVQATTPASTRTPSPPTSSYSSQDVLHFLIAHQSFSGVFPYHPRVLACLGISDADFGRLLKKTCGDIDEGKGGCLLTTALAIVYMEKNLVAFKGEWELVVDKAWSWLEEERRGCDGGADVFLKAAETLL